LIQRWSAFLIDKIYKKGGATLDILSMRTATHLFIEEKRAWCNFGYFVSRKVALSFFVNKKNGATLDILSMIKALSAILDFFVDENDDASFYQ